MLRDINDRFLLTQLKRDEKYAKIAIFITAILAFAILGNVLYLNILFFSQRYSPNNTQAQKQEVIISPTEEPEEDITSSPAVSIKSSEGVIVETINVKDYFVPLGSGTSQAGDWADVPGVQAVVDFGQYKNIKEIRFEASVTVPTANQSVSVRLYNVTDKHPVWYSEVSMPGGASSYFSNSAFL